jgi:hypothetical protein
VVTGRGRLVVVSGQVAQDEHGELVGPGDPAAQARQVFENLRRVPGRGGGRLRRCSEADVPRSRCRGPARGPGSPRCRHRHRPAAGEHGVQVAALFAAGYLLEVEARRWPATDYHAPASTRRDTALGRQGHNRRPC